MTELRRRRAAQGQPIAARLRRHVYMLWALLFLVCGTAVGALQIQSNGVDRLTLAIGPAVDANNQVLHFMSDAETELLGYEFSHDLQRLTHYRADRARTMAALATLQDNIVLASGGHADDALDTGLATRQRLVVGLCAGHGASCASRRQDRCPAGSRPVRQLPSGERRAR